ncbi:unnamed protein product, partial [Iphiclides podalirius]
MREEVRALALGTLGTLGKLGSGVCRPPATGARGPQQVARCEFGERRAASGSIRRLRSERGGGRRGAPPVAKAPRAAPDETTRREGACRARRTCPWAPHRPPRGPRPPSTTRADAKSHCLGSVRAQ